MMRQESKLQYFVPEKFWRCLRLRGQPVNVREQQDSFEFFTHLVDSIDEHLFKIEREKLFHSLLGGVFSDQMICKECPHRYEREQIFLALNLTVKSHNLVDSLEQFVKGELLEGDNAYYCEECGVKVTILYYYHHIWSSIIPLLPLLVCFNMIFFLAEKHGETDVHQDFTVDFGHPVKTILLRLGCGPFPQIRWLLPGNLWHFLCPISQSIFSLLDSL